MKGWRLPAGAVCVTRPGKWGNPFTVRGPDCNGLWKTAHCDVVTGVFMTQVEAAKLAVKLFEKAIRSGRMPVTVDDVRRELRGKDLACFCRLGSPCHADVLLRIANEETR